MKQSFSRSFDPPAPVVPARLRAPGGDEIVHVDGKIDTGSDLCAVPERLVAALDLPPVRTVRAAGFAGEPREAIVFRVDLEIDGMVFRRVEALATSRPYLLVGRNVLRRLVARLDGPREQLDIRRPRA
jgi:predicted aspartyl protease